MTTNAHQQTGRLFLFSLKKECLKILFWLIGISLFIFFGLGAYIEMYGDALQREAMALTMQNPAMEALFGRVIGLDNYTIGAMYSHTMTIMMLSVIAVMSILLVVRNTRAEEENGILEILRSLPTGQLAHTSSAIFLLLITNLCQMLLTIVIISSLGDSSMNLEGSLLTGVIYGSAGLFFGAVALLMAQLSSSARNTTMWSFAVLGFSYLLRIVGDISEEILSWISPLGLLYGTEPFVENNWWPIMVIQAATWSIVGFALYLQHQRDIGTGLFPDRTGSRHASPYLQWTAGFAFRLLKTTLIVWVVTVAVFAATYGSVIGDVERLLEGNELIEAMLEAESETDLMNQFISMIIGILALIATIPSLQVFLRLKEEEKKNRTEKIVTGNRSRVIILGTFFAISFLTSILMQFVQLVTFAGSALVMDFDINVTDIFGAGLAYLPAIWIMIGLSVSLYGWLPKFASFIWGYLGFAFIVLYFSGLFDMPEWMMGISPFYHIPQLLNEEWSWSVTIVLTIIAAVVTFTGFIGYQRRDING